MRPTLRRNGHHMITIQVRHDLGAESLMQALVWASGDLVATEVPTRAVVEAYIHDFTSTYGDMAMADTDLEDYYSTNDLARRREWARSIIQRLWPTMAAELDAP